MPACAIRYRLDMPGPTVYLVECEGKYHLYTRGSLGAALPATRVPGLLATHANHWVTASGDLYLEGSAQPRMPRPTDATTNRPPDLDVIDDGGAVAY